MSSQIFVKGDAFESLKLIQLWLLWDFSKSFCLDSSLHNLLSSNFGSHTSIYLETSGLEKTALFQLRQVAVWFSFWFIIVFCFLPLCPAAERSRGALALNQPVQFHPYHSIQWSSHFSQGVEEGAMRQIDPGIVQEHMLLCTSEICSPTRGLLFQLNLL